MVLGRNVKILVVMKVALLLFLVFVFFPAKGYELDSENVVGTWECEDFPRGLLNDLKSKKVSVKCIIEIKEDGSFTVSNFPIRSPYRLTNIKGDWKIISGKMTPSGKDSLYLNGSFLSGRKKGVSNYLEYIVSGKDEYKLLFSKKKKKIEKRQ